MIREGKQFRLVKFFALASFVVLVIFSFPFSIVISQKGKDILLKSYEDYALWLGRNLNYQVLEYVTQPLYSIYGEDIRLGEPKARELMDRVVRDTIRGLKVDVVNLYKTTEGEIIYSTDPKRIRSKPIETPEYWKAVQGEQSSRLRPETEEFWGFLGIQRIGAVMKISTYIPHISGYDTLTKEKHVAGVFEIILDITEQYKSTVRLQYSIFGLSTLIMAFIFVALLFIVKKAEDIIEQRASEQHELSEQLSQTERLAALGEMVAAVSHEIKNPLGIIQSTSELLGGTPGANDTRKRLSKVILEESVRLNQIVTEFLDFSRPQALNLRECDLKEIIRKNLSFMKPEMDKKGITVKDNLNGRSIRLIADKELLYLAILNILLNATQSMEDGGAIDIRVSEERGHYRIEIEDMGSGISGENMKRVFDPFFTTKEKGSGLGLPIVKKIIEGHRGTIGIQSREREGTKVEIRLPRMK
ncbi:MAG: two-component sensor histidine kinase [Deltaproteobacteria bacterium]|nr:two-component sensor histidine kinase [Deltaproteobacteria bacterium]